MKAAVRNRRVSAYFLCLGLLLGLNLVVGPRVTGHAQPATASGVQEACPGERMSTQVTGGEYQGRTVPEAIVNGEPWGGAYFEAGVRSYWHCHPGGQLLVVWEGEGRVQKRGERARTLHPGESEYAGPWVEHWHGGSPASAAQYLQVAFQPTGTLWMEEVRQDDYLGNDVGIDSRNEFLQTGMREQP
jgi:hypothetical protein